MKISNLSILFIVVLSTGTANAFAPVHHQSSQLRSTSSISTTISATSSPKFASWEDAVSNVQDRLTKAKQQVEESHSRAVDDLIEQAKDLQTKLDSLGDELQTTLDNMDIDQAKEDMDEAREKVQQHLEEARERISDRTDHRLKEFTGKDDYNFGDISQQVLQRIQQGEYKVEDVFMVVKTMAIAGVNLNPLAQLFPFKLLVELLNYSLKLDINARLNVHIATEIDRRLKVAIDTKKEELGDHTRRALAEFTGKETYEAGDVLREVEERMTTAIGQVQDELQTATETARTAVAATATATATATTIDMDAVTATKDEQPVEVEVEVVQQPLGEVDWEDLLVGEIVNELNDVDVIVDADSEEIVTDES